MRFVIRGKKIKWDPLKKKKKRQKPRSKLCLSKVLLINWMKCGFLKLLSKRDLNNTRWSQKFCNILITRGTTSAAPDAFASHEADEPYWTMRFRAHIKYSSSAVCLYDLEHGFGIHGFRSTTGNDGISSSKKVLEKRINFGAKVNLKWKHARVPRIWEKPN